MNAPLALSLSNGLQLTALAVLALPVFCAATFALAWLHHHAAHGTLRPALRDLARETFHFLVAGGLGLLAGAAYYLAWCATWP